MSSVFSSNLSNDAFDSSRDLLDLLDDSSLEVSPQLLPDSASSIPQVPVFGSLSQSSKTLVGRDLDSAFYNQEVLPHGPPTPSRPITIPYSRRTGHIGGHRRPPTYGPPDQLRPPRSSASSFYDPYLPSPTSLQDCMSPDSAYSYSASPVNQHINPTLDELLAGAGSSFVPDPVNYQGTQPLEAGFEYFCPEPPRSNPSGQDSLRSELSIRLARASLKSSGQLLSPVPTDVASPASPWEQRTQPRCSSGFASCVPSEHSSRAQSRTRTIEDPGHCDDPQLCAPPSCTATGGGSKIRASHGYQELGTSPTITTGHSLRGPSYASVRMSRYDSNSNNGDKSSPNEYSSTTLGSPFEPVRASYESFLANTGASAPMTVQSAMWNQAYWQPVEHNASAVQLDNNIGLTQDETQYQQQLAQHVRSRMADNAPQVSGSYTNASVESARLQPMDDLLAATSAASSVEIDQPEFLTSWTPHDNITSGMEPQQMQNVNALLQNQYFQPEGSDFVTPELRTPSTRTLSAQPQPEEQMYAMAFPDSSWDPSLQQPVQDTNEIFTMDEGFAPLGPAAAGYSSVPMSQSVSAHSMGSSPGYYQPSRGYTPAQAESFSLPTSRGYESTSATSGKRKARFPTQAELVQTKFHSPYSRSTPDSEGQHPRKISRIGETGRGGPVDVHSIGSNFAAQATPSTTTQFFRSSNVPAMTTAQGTYAQLGGPVQNRNRSKSTPTTALGPTQRAARPNFSPLGPSSAVRSTQTSTHAHIPNFYNFDDIKEESEELTVPAKTVLQSSNDPPAHLLSFARIQIQGCYKDAHPFLISRMAEEQVHRFTRLLQRRREHIAAVLAGTCPSGKHCSGIHPHHLNIDIVVNGSSMPPPPVHTPMPATFECPLCFAVKTFAKRSDWTKHLHEDLMPFTCTFEDCPASASTSQSHGHGHTSSPSPTTDARGGGTPHRSFKRKADWVRHEAERHRRREYWLCSIDRCGHCCFRKDNFVQHLVREHKQPEPRVKARARERRERCLEQEGDGAGVDRDDRGEEGAAQTMAIVESSRRVVPVQSAGIMPGRGAGEGEEERKNDTHRGRAAAPLECCGFCGFEAANEKKLMVHLDYHMEDIALPVVQLLDEACGSRAATRAQVSMVPQLQQQQWLQRGYSLEQGTVQVEEQEEGEGDGEGDDEYDYE